MMLEPTIFLFQFLIVMGIFILTLWDLMKEGSFMDWRHSIVGFALFLLFNSIGHNIQMLDPETIIYSTIMMYQTFLSYMYWLFLAITIFLKIKLSTTKGNEAYAPER